MRPQGSTSNDASLRRPSRRRFFINDILRAIGDREAGRQEEELANAELARDIEETVRDVAALTRELRALRRKW